MSRPRKCDCGTCKLCKNREYDKRRQNDPARKAYKTDYQRGYMRERRQDPAVREFDRKIARNWYRVQGNAAVVRARDLKRLYGRTPEDVDRMIEEQQGCCSACGEPFEDTHARKPVVDHDARLGNCREAVRGMLHQECNRTLGYIEACRARLPELLEYADSAQKRLKTAV